MNVHKNYIKALMLAAGALLAGRATAQKPVTFIQKDIVKAAGATTDSLMYSLASKYRQSMRVYVDGLGRPIQTVAIQASPLKNDLIQPVVYDNLGRQPVTYLPYAGQSTDTMGSYRSNALTAQAAFYNNTAQHLIATDTAAHMRQGFESSPLQRLLSAGDVGTGYQQGGSGTQYYKTVSYRPNKSATDGNIYITGTTGTFSTSSVYADGALWVTDAKDEDGRESEEFKDLAGRTVLKRQMTGSAAEPYLDTYYIYNYAGNISYIVPPKALHLIVSNGYTLTTAQIANLIYAYSYNNLGLLYCKTVPNKGATFIIYDPQNRPILARDSNMAGKHQWYYIKYDAKDRPVETGIYTDGAHLTYSAELSNVNTSYGTTYWYETRSTSITYKYYTNNVFPTSGTTPMSYNYYDNYDYNGDGTYDYSYTPQGLSGEAAQATDSLKGLPTMSLRLVVGPGVSGTTWLMSAMFYDQYGHVIQTRTNNLLYFADHVLTDTRTVVPDYTGKPLIIKTTVVTGTTSGTTNSVTTMFNYDSNNIRLASIDQVYNSQAAKRIVAYGYNEAGQLVLRKLDSLAGNWLQNVDYRYNIRGQLTSINNSKLANDSGVTNSDTNDLFGMTLLYDQTDTNLPTDTASHAGLLTAVKWMSRDGSDNLTNERSYVYSYDKLGRYTRANYNERTAAGTGAFNINTDGFDENGVSYDEAGNIQTLKRTSSSGVGATSHTQADNLTYTYDTTKPNQLNSISDAGSATQGFITPNGTSGSYAYDNDGNLITDPYKGLSLKYNAINRVDSIVNTQTGANGAYIAYTYDASGAVLRKQVYSTSTTLLNQTDYIGSYVYTTASGSTNLTYITNPEGRLMNTGGSGTVTLTPEYVITDQQGNARFSFEDNGTSLVIRQENSYYAFGETYSSNTVTPPSSSNKDLYNGGSEWQNDFNNLPDYQQTFYRNYDAEIGRFIAVDPEPESTESLSVYQYAGNNPIMMNDPMGNLPVPNTPPIDINAFGQSLAYGGGAGNYMMDQFNPIGGDASNYSPWDPVGTWAAVETSPDYQNYLQGLVNKDQGAIDARNMAGESAGGINVTAASQLFAAYQQEERYYGGADLSQIGNSIVVGSTVTIWTYDENGNISSGAAVYHYRNVDISSNGAGISGANQGDGFNALESLGQVSDGISGGINELKASGISALAEQGETVEKYIGPLGYGIAVLNVGAAFRKDNYQFGANTQKATLQAAGGWAGAEIGAEGGAEFGAFIGSFVGPWGTVIGGVVGGIAGGIYGGIKGGDIGGDLYDKIGN